MPNYVYNILEIRSKKDNPNDIIDFIKQHYNSDGFLDFNTFIPEPRTEDECPPEYNFNHPMGSSNWHNGSLEVLDNKDWFNWYDWRLKYWGTKWNAGSESKCYYDFDKICENYSYSSPIYIYFNTAWTPPVPIFEQVFKQHPELKINITYYSTDNGEFGEIREFDSGWDDYHWELTGYTEQHIEE